MTQTPGQQEDAAADVPAGDGAARDRGVRWRLVLGSAAEEPLGGTGVRGLLDEADARRDGVLDQLYGDGDRRGGLGSSSPRVARWLGDIRSYFPSSVVQVMQADAMHRLGLRQLLLEPEMMAAVQPDMDLVTTLIGLGRAIPERSRESERQVVLSVTEQLDERLLSESG